MKKIVLMFFICFYSLCYSEDVFFERKKMDIKIDANYVEKQLNVRITIRNKSNRIYYIPYEYLNFYCATDSGYTMKNNWLLIINENNEEIGYSGIVGDYRNNNRQKENMYLLPPDGECVISLNSIQNYYVFGDSNTITIQYLGPLGQSDIVKISLQK